MVADSDADARIEQTILLQNRQQQTTQRGVSFMPRFVRENSGQPSSLSRLRMVRVRFGWLFSRSFAACDTLPYFAT